MPLPKGFKHSKETLERMKLSHLGVSHPVSLETKERLRVINTGKILSPKHKEKIRLSLLGNKRCVGLKRSNEYKKKMSEKLKGRKLTKEWKEKIGNANRGKKRTSETKMLYSLVQKGNQHRLGAVLSDETKKKISFSNKGKTSPRKGIHLSEETKRKMSLSRKGIYCKENHPSWKGGITTLRVQIWNLDEYKSWRKEIFERDKYTCLICGKIGGEINAHHIMPFSVIKAKWNIKSIEDARKCQELWNVNNGITLCKSCHYLKKKETKDKIKNFELANSLY